MKKILLVLVMTALVAGCGSQRKNSASSGGAAAQGIAQGAEAEAIDRLNDSAEVLRELTAAGDSQIPKEVLDDAKCVAVVPSMMKGGFVFGAQHGRGVATCRTAQGTWSAPAFFTISGGSWGPQIGMQAVDLVMMIMNEQGMRDLLSAKFKLGASGSVAAGPVGRHASANTDWKAQSGILTYSRTRGLFAGLDLNGAVVDVDHESQSAFYGREVEFANVLRGQTPTPRHAQAFLASVRQSFAQAVAQEEQP